MDCKWTPTCPAGTCKSTACPFFGVGYGADLDPLDAPDAPSLKARADDIIRFLSTADNYTTAHNFVLKILAEERARDVLTMIDVRAFAARTIRERRRVHITYCVAGCDLGRELENLAQAIEKMRVPVKS